MEALTTSILFGLDHADIFERGRGGRKTREFIGFINTFVPLAAHMSLRTNWTTSLVLAALRTYVASIAPVAWGII